MYSLALVQFVCIPSSQWYETSIEIVNKIDLRWWCKALWFGYRIGTANAKQFQPENGKERERSKDYYTDNYWCCEDILK